MAGDSTQRRLVAILSADVAGYSRLMNKDEAGTLAALKAHRAEFIDPTVAGYGGRCEADPGRSTGCWHSRSSARSATIR